MRPCVERVLESRRHLIGSNSILGLMVHNELVGVRCFTCEKIEELGECLGGECYSYRGVRGPGPLTGVRGREPPSEETPSPAPHLITTTIDGFHVPVHQGKRRLWGEEL